MWKVVVLIALFLLPCCILGKSLQCLDEKQQPIDWFYMYKFPKHISPNGTGLDFVYLHERSNGWQLSERMIDDARSLPGSLISQLTDEDLVIMYNDEPPEDKSDETRGHTKGVVAATARGNDGFWLVHSVPKYPASDYKSYTYPPTGHSYGQSFLCISLKTPTDLESVGRLIRFNEPHVYVGQADPTFQSVYPNLFQVATNRSWITEPPFYRTEKLAEEWTVFSKSSKFNKELYVDLVAPTLQSDLLVESWLHGPGVIQSECDKPFKVYNVETIEFPAGQGFKSMADHSKWAVGKEANWICVGDINRADHQKRRGGGTVCRYGKYPANAYRSLVDSMYPCSNNGSSLV